MSSTVIAICILALFLYLKCFGRYKSLPLPPGPKKLPIIGNLLDIPKKFEWITYHNWCKEFGRDVLRHIIVKLPLTFIKAPISSMSTLRVPQSSSSITLRSKMTMIELIGWGSAVGVLPYGQDHSIGRSASISDEFISSLGDFWRSSRRLLHRELHPAAAVRFHPHELKATRGLLRRLLVSSDDLMEELIQMAGETIMSMTYGIKVDSKDDPYIQIAKEGVQGFVIAAVPGAFLVDSIPFLRFIPDWMPFAGFKRQAKYWRKQVRYMFNKPYEVAKHNIKPTPLFDNAAGSDTTVSAILTGILGLLANPQALKKAQDEIDRVIGSDNLPTFDDETSLPYITAITKEALRWRVVAPICTNPLA
ncbi:hypothetical protein C0993_009945 [Termitomyces sp. T159_Od127]|nr:hypothetical protein C0993_009945 [Termitomyces sp. T159_Od127]